MGKRKKLEEKDKEKENFNKRTYQEHQQYTSNDFSCFSRSLASAAKSTKPPIQLFGIDGTYANALYSATIQQSDMAQTYKSLEKIENVIKGTHN